MSESRTAYRATLGVAIVLGLGILGLVNWLGARHYRRFDWTSSGLYTLSDKTRNVVKDLKTPVSVTVFMVQGSPLYSETQELLRRYRALSPMISVEQIDSTRDPARAEKLIKEFALSERSGAVVFKSGDKKKYVTEDKLAELDFSRARMGGEPTIKAFKGEQEFTSAILAVTQSKAPRVLFVTGHGERTLDGRGRDGFYAVAETLRRDNCIVEAWQSLGASEVPAGTDLLIVAAPKSSYTEPEVAALKKYLTEGGRGLLFLDAEFGPGGALAETGLKPLLADFGLSLDDDIIVDPKNALPMMGLETVFARSFRPHPITKLLEGSVVVLPLARSVTALAKPPAGLTVTPLVETSADGWGETNLKDLEKVEKDDKDVKGPLAVAAAVEGAENPATKSRTRLVVFGDASFADNGGIANAANLYLVTGAANWVMEREALVAIPPRAADQLAVTLSRTDIAGVAFFVLLVLPLSAILLGLAVWIRRRR